MSMLYSIELLDELRARVQEAKGSGQRVGFVPTMGNLHDGHIQLVQTAKEQCDVVVSSIFVNPLQFGVGEDLEAYPRTLASDQHKLEAAGCDLLYIPSVSTMYPEGEVNQTRVKVPGVSEGLCGESRPIHFEGVATVVTKLFNMVMPDVAFFGKKDYQQLAVIRKLVSDLAMPIEVVGVDTVRAEDGLALSSRNQYLSESERAIAPQLYQILTEVSKRLLEKPSEWQDAQQYGIHALVEAGLKPDYLEVREARGLGKPSVSDHQWVILVAAYLGKARLIDNLEVALNRLKD